TDLALAQKSAARLANLSAIDTVLTGDGWPVFKQGSAALKRLLET
ncbi:MBL fold metallo-hydrolase, partial [Methylococcaceae bacterium HT1]